MGSFWLDSPAPVRAALVDAYYASTLADLSFAEDAIHIYAPEPVEEVTE